MARILIVEDDQELADNLGKYLKRQNYIPEIVSNASDADFRLSTYGYDLIILDIGLPDQSGLSVLKTFRANGGRTPVIFLTGESDIETKERGLDYGADDYVTKPYDARELAARVRAVLRRPKEIQDATLTVGCLELDTRHVKAKFRGEEIDLTAIEFSLLELFMKHPDEHFSSQGLMDRIWSSESESSTDVVRVHITKLRKKLASISEKQVIRTMRGLGYYLDSKSLES